MELQCVMKAALRDDVLGQCERLEEQVRSRQDAVHGLRSRWQSIVDFRQRVVSLSLHLLFRLHFLFDGAFWSVF